MKLVNRSKLMQAALVCVGATFLTTFAVAQDYASPPSFSSRQLDTLVSRIALYPDPLLAQIFAAASFPEQIPDAARWADQYRNLRGNELADAMSQANFQFEPAVQALIPFPTVLDMLARDTNWTSELGNAVLADRSEVMDAVQRMRRSAEEYGYLRSNQRINVINTGAAVEIESADPSEIYVPVYDPYVVYAPPRPGFFIGGAIGFEPYYSIGAFGGWGWGGGFNWYNHAVFVNHAEWGRTWYNRDAYVHNYGNWDRGAWRNGNAYESRNNGFRNDGNRYSRSDSTRYYRGGQSSPAVQNQSYDRGNGNQNRTVYGNQGSAYRGSQSAPTVQDRTFERSNGNRYGNNSANGGGNYRGGQAAPVTPSQSYDRNNGSQYRNGNQNSYGGGQPASPAPNRSYERNPGNSYPSRQFAPATPSQTYAPATSGYANRSTQSAPMTQGRSFERNMNTNSGHQGGGEGANGGSRAGRR